MSDFKVGELIVYKNGDRIEIGKIKRLVEDGAFVWYSTGETAAKTPFDAMYKIANGYAITETELGGMAAKKAITEEVQIHGAMVYGCRDCGSRWIMYLEKGLEEPGCDDRKPVPFGIRCPFCGGFQAYDISGYLKLDGPGYHTLPENVSYFANLPDRDCGVPQISGMMDRLEESDIPSAKIRERKVTENERECV